ncbi:MAG: hypothetical protein GY833_06205, partial [Aestuariibacter sp.]|nr:hypothetical protein [Aestuariibacter sp.]
MKKLIYRVPLKALQTIPLLICVFWYLNRTMFGGMHDMIIMAIFIGCLILSFALTRFKQIQLLRMCIYAGTAVIGLTIFYTFILYWQRHLPVSPKWQDIARLLSSTDRRLAELNLQLLPWVSMIFGLVGSALFVYEIFN